MRAKIITFKPNNNGEVAVYLAKGANLHTLIDLSGQEVDIERVGEEIPAYEFDKLIPVMRMIQNSINEAEEKGYQKAREEIEKEGV